MHSHKTARIFGGCPRQLGNAQTTLKGEETENTEMHTGDEDHASQQAQATPFAAGGTTQPIVWFRVLRGFSHQQLQNLHM